MSDQREKQAKEYAERMVEFEKAMTKKAAEEAISSVIKAAIILAFSFFLVWLIYAAVRWAVGTLFHYQLPAPTLPVVLAVWVTWMFIKGIISGIVEAAKRK